MPGKKVRSELKNMIIEESLQPGCVVAGLARQYGISKNTIYGWRSRCNKSTLSSVIPELPAATSGLSSQFVELSINEPEQSLNLQEVTLKFNNLSISMQGQIKSSVLISVVKTLEEVC